MQVSVKIEGADEVAAELRQIGRRAGQVLEAGALAGADVVAGDANRRAPGPNIHAEVVERSQSSVTVDIGPDEEHWYYKFFETGTQPHRITPLNRKALRFEVGDEEIFALAVQHPGMAAQPFLRPALDENADGAAGAAGQALRRLLGI